MVVLSVFQHGKLIISAFSGTGMMLCNKHIWWCNLQLLHTTWSIFLWAISQCKVQHTKKTNLNWVAGTSYKSVHW